MVPATHHVEPLPFGVEMESCFRNVWVFQHAQVLHLPQYGSQLMREKGKIPKLWLFVVHHDFNTEHSEAFNII